ncbi:hypothetical protein EY643_18350 [Halioglobus maricola]|uniref:Transcriptional regulator SutA RNAP-binding domain-containing protein n=1 Tax=Halioglobus maricola TaxID=2601894 RepID=A0A5P9NNM7_9GAMM|nr:hypothetical protein [Halioglobus maricola]QFU77473.1 hypothetical protein EY643_18350 [Halioglobus maricola]
MKRHNNTINESEKKRIRDEIDTQIAQFLETGGKIDVLSGNSNDSKRVIGSVWHHGEDLPSQGQ